MQESLNVKSYISNHCSGLLIKTSVPNLNSDFGFTLSLPAMDEKDNDPSGLNGK